MDKMDWSRPILSMMDGTRMVWKRTLSYRKREWEFRDYPVRVWDQGAPLALPSRFTNHRYRALILGWLIDATGDSRKEALAALEEQYVRRKQLCVDAGEPIPRPGTRVSIKIASRTKLDAHADVEEDFIRRILHPVLGIEDVHMTDGSSLWNFHFDEDSSALISKIREVYGVDVSDIESENVVEILERIAAKQVDK